MSSLPLTREEMLTAVAKGAAIAHKEVLRWPEEVCLLLGCSMSTAKRFIKRNGIVLFKYLPEEPDQQSAKFVKAKDLQKALRFCQPAQGKGR